jgi:hypothetical protein
LSDIDLTQPWTAFHPHLKIQFCIFAFGPDVRQCCRSRGLEPKARNFDRLDPAAFAFGVRVDCRQEIVVARSEDTWSRDAAIAALLAYCAVFCFNTAYGRLCPGLAYAGVSRYTPDVVLGFFGLYLYALSNQRSKLARLFATDVASLCRAWLVGKMSDGLSTWRNCYLACHNIHHGDRLTHFQIYPHPEATHLQETLDLLERNRLNLYADSQ